MTDAALDASTASAVDVVRRGVAGTYVVFIALGFAFASWAARIPQVRDHLRLSPAELGLVLLCIAIGSLVAIPLAGPLVHRFGPRRSVSVMAVVLAGGLVGVAMGYVVGVPLVAVSLFFVGLGNGGWDVGMNVHGALVERQLGRSIMSRFHAGYSLGTVAGAGVGAVMVAVHVPVTAHLLVVAGVIGTASWVGTRRFVAEGHDLDGAEQAERPRAFAAWRERRTLLVGVFVLTFAFAEGAGGDWLAVATIDGHHSSAAVGTTAFATFLAAMTIGRWFGPAVLDRHGRVRVVRSLAALAGAGSILFVFAPSTALAFAGAALWGLGTSLGFPVGMSAGADEPRHAAGRVSVIASIGYCAFLAGPPAIGFLGNTVTVLHALLLVAVLLVLAAVIAGAVAPPTSEPQSTLTRTTGAGG